MAVITLRTEQFNRLSGFIEEEVGIKMPPSKRVMLESRLQKRLRALDIATFDEYLQYVFESDGGEITHMIDVVTTNKTDFFREPDHFVYLRETLLPHHYDHDQWGKGGRFKVWSSASSTGEEAYTLAIILSEFQRHAGGQFDFRILGTDISTSVLETARKGIYPEERVAPVTEEFRRRYFLRSKDRDNRFVRVKRALREKVQFHRMNLMDDRYPLSDRFHVIFCRNVMIYFERRRQEELLRKLYNYLVPGGYLFLGHSETLAGMDLPVVSVAPTVYRRVMMEDAVNG